MTKYLIYLCAVVVAPAAIALTFQEYQQLPQTQRSALLTDKASPLHEEARRWEWRLALGEKGWTRKEEERLVMLGDYTWIRSFFIDYADICQVYIANKWRAEHADVTKVQPGENEAAVASMDQAYQLLEMQSLCLRL